MLFRYIVPVLLLATVSVVQSAPKPAPGRKTNTALAGAAIAGVGYLIHRNRRQCKDIGIANGLCAVMYEDEECDTSDDYKELRHGDSGKLPYSVTTLGLSRNDVESMIVNTGCKLEVWDDANGLRNGANPDLVIDQTGKPVRYVDDMRDEDAFMSDKWADLKNAISSYRCSCGPALVVSGGNA